MDVSEIDALSSYLAPYTLPWCVAGGWAVDLHLNRRTRRHDDVDVMVLDRDVGTFYAAMVGSLDLFAERPETGERFEWKPGQALTPGVEALAADIDLGHGSTKVQFLVARTDGGDWVYHRGGGTLRLPLEEIALNRAGTPYLTPRVLLLFKSRQMRPKDDADFQVLSDALDPSECRWLLDRLRGWQRDHPWIEPLMERAADDA